MKHLVMLLALSLTPAFGLAQTAATAPGLSSGSWKINGDVEGTSVVLTCAIVETNKVLSGSCTGDDGVAHPIKGRVQERVVTWAFDSAYQGQPIKVEMSGMIDSTGLKMSGSIAIDPLQTDGEFGATKQSI